MRCTCFSRLARASLACNCQKRLESRRRRLGLCCIASGKPVVPTLRSFAGSSKSMNFVGGIEANKHEHKKLKAGCGTVGKTAVLEMRERGGRTVATPIANTDAGTVNSSACRNRLNLAYRRSRGLCGHRRHVFRLRHSQSQRRRVCSRRRDHERDRTFSRFSNAA